MSIKVTSLPDAEPRPRNVAIGTFDGVHLGHRAVIDGADTVPHLRPAPARSPAPGGDRAAAHPDVRSDVDRLAEFFAAPLLRVERVQRRVDLHRRSKQGEVADPHRTDVQDNAVEIEEHPLAELDIRTVVAIERRLHPHAVAALTEQVAQHAATFRLLRLARGVELLTEITRPGTRRQQLGIERVVHFARQHLLALSGHHRGTVSRKDSASECGLPSLGRSDSRHRRSDRTAPEREVVDLASALLVCPTPTAASRRWGGSAGHRLG